ncbi:hypothetical protein SAY86_001678 [Trapa natans]|uniref:Uncharacterized protein n=1 Tax=Trapa natans TaxID=22666 RepID=A0AAN7LHX5_TRANT|nr:hypothetical protein SAY86_001678 [Trapa natans]
MMIHPDPHDQLKRKIKGGSFCKALERLGRRDNRLGGTSENRIKQRARSKRKRSKLQQLTDEMEAENSHPEVQMPGEESQPRRNRYSLALQSFFSSNVIPSSLFNALLFLSSFSISSTATGKYRIGHIQASIFLCCRDQITITSSHG